MQCPHCGQDIPVAVVFPPHDPTLPGKARRELLMVALRSFPGAPLRILALHVGLSPDSPANITRHLSILERQGRVTQIGRRWRVVEGVN
jgi:hypothetical protein